ncbi:MAG: hypothetical protein AVDCRST_MAG59-2255 [uncultured Thermomicrobiales bacterium]|uniref:Uncharacterized protein n=1 Tax=uncultured Thermomicrobiales bacterium TaxID=1645740 RepID=A0A6J4URW8_9BACT|nr:MAG: hypothetical protein AVDCRST_MAG59-2255 [uncultured Thermomicrobiales bacterium]
MGRRIRLGGYGTERGFQGGFVDSDTGVLGTVDSPRAGATKPRAWS